jgi:hypothetical protein
MYSSLMIATAAMQTQTTHLAFDSTAFFTILAVLLGPIFAVQAQKWIERRREERNRKLWLFRELMATRGSRISTRHVDALNTIDLEYSPTNEKQKAVHEAWRLYFDALNTPAPDPLNPSAYFQNRDDLFVSMMYAMAKFLGFHFDKVAIKRNSYTPIGQGHLEDDLNIIRKGLAKVFTSKSTAVPIRVVDENYEGKPLVTAADIYGPTPIE